MDLAAIYQGIQERIEKVDFSKLWKGFSPLKFAVYTDSECFFDGAYIQKTDDFCANTTIQFRGENIAIWQIFEEPEDMDALTALLIHEMFHAFQHNSGECRWANEMEALFRYQYSLGNLSAKREEARCIRAALAGEEPGAYERLLRLRKARAEQYPYEYDYEARVEQIEGSANFVETNALSQLSPEKGQAAWRKILDQITGPANYFPIRIISYGIGAAALACVRKWGGMDWESFSDQPFACEMAAHAQEGENLPADDPQMARAMDQYAAETHRLIRAAVEKNDCILKGKYPLEGVNIWDARREGNFLTSNYFLQYRDGGSCKTLNGNFVLETDGAYNVLAVWRQ